MSIAFFFVALGLPNKKIARLSWPQVERGRVQLTQIDICLKVLLCVSKEIVCARKGTKMDEIMTTYSPLPHESVCLDFQTKNYPFLLNRLFGITLRNIIKLFPCLNPFNDDNVINRVEHLKSCGNQSNYMCTLKRNDLPRRCLSKSVQR